MLDRVLIGLGVFIIIALIGFFVQLIPALRIVKEREFLEKYSDHFFDYVKNKNYDSFSSLLLEMNETQRLIGRNGYVSIQRPFENGYHTNIPITSLIPQIEEERKMEYGDPDFYIRTVQVAIISTIGDYNFHIEATKKEMFNIFVDFYKGFNWLLSLPFVILGYLFTGNNVFLTSKHKSATIFFKILLSVLQITGTISGIMTIILGYKEFAEVIRSWFV